MLLVTRRNINSLIACFFLTLLSTVLILIQSATVCGQGNGTASTGTGGSHLITGKIYFPSGRRAEGVIQVKLESFSAGEITTLADANGAFTFASLSPGNYTVVVNAEGYEIAREGVTIDSDLNLSRAGISVNTPQRRYTVIVNLQPKRGSENQAGAAVINAALAEVPEAARNLYEKALQLEQSNNIANAIDNLKAAISLYPKFPQALNELGVQYLKLGQPYKAVEPLRAASKLTPEAPLPKLNLGIALLETRQFTEAETQLREVLKLNDAIPTAHMYLGIATVKLRNYPEAEKELRRAIELGGNQIVLAHYYLGGIYWQARDYRRAVDELETYLRLSPNAPDAERVKTTIKDLRAKI